MPDPLADYNAKRDFTRTAEPAGVAPAEPAGRGAPGSNAPTFVVQKHAARALHYDVRFEIDGVMPSWAVPKGPSYDPKVKRLAVHVEDHPLDYRDFEGAIPSGEYGGGRVIVWDRGTYRNITEKNGQPVDARTAIEQGHLSIWFDGEKLHGGWSLTRTGQNRSGKEQWIMVKRKDEFADPSLDVTADRPESVASGRPVEEVGDGDPTWTRGVATWAPPALAQLVKAPPAADEWRAGEWRYERKLDGLRAVAVRNGDQVELWSRNHLSFSERFPEVVTALAYLPVENFTLDGEIVAFDGDRTSFELLQRAGGAGRAGKAVYVVFDILHLLGNDTTALPQADRSRLVAEVLDGAGEHLEASRALEGDPATLLASACEQGWEGIVAKRSDAPYTTGRPHNWLKLKCDASQELVIGGWTDPKGARQHLGAILVGYHDAGGTLRYAGKVGSGFDHATLELLHEQLVERAESPFADSPRMRDAHWAEPTLVANVAFTEWTADGKLRHPRLQGLRPDKAAAEVVRERPT